MPMVNGKMFSYDAKGMKAAKAAASKTGKKMVVTKAVKKAAKAKKRGK